MGSLFPQDILAMSHGGVKAGECKATRKSDSSRRVRTFQIETVKHEETII
jgi:hypothetical protein